mmetsp:Transcript_66563/g.156703  ORF Transcript_66563/g.156703 Transcript_66563/m.156703 type:complete len:401 (+) Transcript_66563:604-1806(+)
MGIFNLARASLPLANVIDIDLVVAIPALPHQVWWNDNRLELVDLLELLCLREGRASHATELVKEPEEALVRDTGQGDGLGLDLHILLSLDGLVESVTPSPALHNSARELVHDHDFTALHDVGLVFDVQLFRIQRVCDKGKPGILWIEEVIFAKQFLGRLHASLDEDTLPLLLVHCVVHLFSQGLGNLVGHLILRWRVLRDARDDQRGSGLVNEDGVHLIHDGKIERGGLPQAQVSRRGRHLIAKVVEAELTVGDVRDVATVGFLLLVCGHTILHHADSHPEKAEGLPHPLGVASSEVVIYGDHVAALARQGIEECCEDGDQGLALARAHLGNVSFVKRDASHHLDVKVAQAEDSNRALADQCEGFWQKRVEGLLTALGSGLQLLGEFAQLCIGARFHGTL